MLPFFLPLKISGVLLSACFFVEPRLVLLSNEFDFVSQLGGESLAGTQQVFRILETLDAHGCCHPFPLTIEVLTPLVKDPRLLRDFFDRHGRSATMQCEQRM